jgi:hypothetical protein
MDKIEGEQPKCHFTINEGDAGNKFGLLLKICPALWKTYILFGH